MSESGKITASHLSRAAVIYVRQSTLAQVERNTESTLRQYDLAAQAARLGWAAGDIEVIDADLGLSGRSATHRDGFKQLVARVCLGEVGRCSVSDQWPGLRSQGRGPRRNRWCWPICAPVRPPGRGRWSRVRSGRRRVRRAGRRPGGRPGAGSAG